MCLGPGLRVHVDRLPVDFLAGQGIAHCPHEDTSYQKGERIHGDKDSGKKSNTSVILLVGIQKREISIRWMSRSWVVSGVENRMREKEIVREPSVINKFMA